MQWQDVTKISHSIFLRFYGTVHYRCLSSFLAPLTAHLTCWHYNLLDIRGHRAETILSMAYQTFQLFNNLTSTKMVGMFVSEWDQSKRCFTNKLAFDVMELFVNEWEQANIVPIGMLRTVLFTSLLCQTYEYVWSVLKPMYSLHNALRPTDIQVDHDDQAIQLQEKLFCWKDQFVDSLAIDIARMFYASKQDKVPIFRNQPIRLCMQSKQNEKKSPIVRLEQTTINAPVVVIENPLPKNRQDPMRRQDENKIAQQCTVQKEHIVQKEDIVQKEYIEQSKKDEEQVKTSESVQEIVQETQNEPSPKPKRWKELKKKLQERKIKKQETQAKERAERIKKRIVIRRWKRVICTVLFVHCLSKQVAKRKLQVTCTKERSSSHTVNQKNAGKDMEKAYAMLFKKDPKTEYEEPSQLYLHFRFAILILRALQQEYKRLFEFFALQKALSPPLHEFMQKLSLLMAPIFMDANQKKIHAAIDLNEKYIWLLNDLMQNAIHVHLTEYLISDKNLAKYKTCMSLFDSLVDVAKNMRICISPISQPLFLSVLWHLYFASPKVAPNHMIVKYTDIEELYPSLVGSFHVIYKGLRRCIEQWLADGFNMDLVTYIRMLQRMTQSAEDIYAEKVLQTVDNKVSKKLELLKKLDDAKKRIRNR